MKPVLPEATDHERRLGALVHLAGIVGPLWLPLAAWFVTRRASAFVAAHAWQEFRDAIVWKGLLLLIGLVSLSFSAARIVHHFQTEWREFDWREIALRAAISLGVFATLWVWNLVQALVQASAAARGVWPKRALRGRARASDPFGA